MFIPSEWRKKVQIKTGPHKMRPKLKAEDIQMVKNLYKIEVNDYIADAILIGRAYTQQLEKIIEWN